MKKKKNNWNCESGGPNVRIVIGTEVPDQLTKEYQL